MTPSKTMTVAASLLLEDATAEQESCAVGETQWACPDCEKDPDGKCQAMRNVEIRKRTAAKLMAMADATRTLARAPFEGRALRVGEGA